MTDTNPSTVLVARGSNDYRYRRYLMVAILIGMAIWCAHDGFYKWPKEEEENRVALLAHPNQPPPHPKRGGLDKPINQILAMALPVLGVMLLGWMFYNSRGAYRLEGTRLTVPGHPTIDLRDVTAIDKSYWDKKGIAYVTYRNGGHEGEMKLDDFIYEREPTDAIVDRIEQSIAAPPQALQPQLKSVIPPPKVRPKF